MPTVLEEIQRREALARQGLEPGQRTFKHPMFQLFFESVFHFHRFNRFNSNRFIDFSALSTIDTDRHNSWIAG